MDVVVFEAGMDFTVRRVGGLKSTLLGGEGLVAGSGGSGRVCQKARSTDAFLSWLVPKLPKRTPPGSRA